MRGRTVAILVTLVVAGTGILEAASREATEGTRAAAAAATPSPDRAAAPPDPRALTYPPLALSFPKPERILLPNGLLVYLFEDHELPLLDAAIDFKAGSIFDPPDGGEGGGAAAGGTSPRRVPGAGAPGAPLPSADPVGRPRRDDRVEFHRRYIHPNNAVMGIAGDFDGKGMKKLLEETFRGWTQAKVNPPPIPKVKDDIQAGLYVVSKPFSQSHVEIGHLGAGRFDPDKFAIKILNFILGEGGFTSRLVKEVRSTRGLAYSVRGGVGLGTDRGLFEISCSTKPASTVEAIDLIRRILRQMREEGPTEQEVKEAKEASINSFVFSVDSTVNFMGSFLYYDFYNYPPDFLRTYRDNLARVTREQVLQAARKRLDPDRMVILVVGNATSFDRPLQSLGLGEPRPLKLDQEPAALPAAR